MKKIIICVLCLVLLCTSLCACSFDRNGNVSTDDGGVITDKTDDNKNETDKTDKTGTDKDKKTDTDGKDVTPDTSQPVTP